MGGDVPLVVVAGYHCSDRAGEIHVMDVVQQGVERQVELNLIKETEGCDHSYL